MAWERGATVAGESHRGRGPPACQAARVPRGWARHAAHTRGVHAGRRVSHSFSCAARCPAAARARSRSPPALALGGRRRRRVAVAVVFVVGLAAARAASRARPAHAVARARSALPRIHAARPVDGAPRRLARPVPAEAVLVEHPIRLLLELHRAYKPRVRPRRSASEPQTRRRARRCPTCAAAACELRRAHRIAPVQLLHLGAHGVDFLGGERARQRACVTPHKKQHAPRRSSASLCAPLGSCGASSRRCGTRRSQCRRPRGRQPRG